MVRIPLDYYRILGLPIQATDEQLKQAHRDRTLQLPRREFSGVAIESRKQLVDEAYNVLSDPSQRKDYDTRFLASTHALESPTTASSPPPELPKPEGKEPLAEVNTQLGEEALRSLASDTVTDAYTPTIEIDDNQLVGALLILLELGEYELAIRLGRPYISSGSNDLSSGKFGDPAVVLSDVVLILSLACLELGREQWQQRQYESAAESLETGRELLLREGLFPAIRNEIQTDLYKLRPYRILELVALPLNRNRERRQGIKLLKAMLQDRGGIDGTEDDLSGLSIDDFLRFAQQLRGYLTSAEQQELFEVEARRPSAVGIYLTIYASMARGFAHHQPASIRRAKKLLKRLGSRQDVHLEQAVCALLLGQTEEASRALELSQEYQPLVFIRENSKGSPDLLPGLCLYAERWLRQEVFPHFRDLSQYETTLKDYFADDQVQTYLESMPIEPDSTEPWVSVPPPSSPTGANTNGHGPPPEQQVAPPNFARPEALASPFQTPQPVTPSVAIPPRSSGEFVARDTAQPITPPVTPADQISEATLGRFPQGFSDPAASTAERISQLSPEGSLQAANRPMGRGDSGASSNQTLGSVPAAQRPGDSPETTGMPSLNRPSRSRRRSTSPNWKNLALVAVVGILAMGTLGFVSMRVIGWVGGLFGGPRLKGVPLALTLDQPPIAIPSSEEIAAQTPGVTDIAQSTLQKWLDAKSAAMGQAHQIDRLDAALSAGQLESWRKRAQDAIDNNWYWEYEHNLEIQSVTPEDPEANALTVQAQVREKADFYEQGRLNPPSSYDETLQMRYELILNEGEWRVQDAQKLN
ncbi:MAG: IMS domain-containing protein [Cyanobacteria bacterium J06635_15]